MKRASEWGLWCLATAALFHRVLLEGAVVVGRDALRVSIPLFEHWTERVRSGGFPDWYAADAFGQSYVGMMVSAPFHPAHLLGLVMPAWWAVTVATLVAYPVAASGAAALARRLGVEERGALLAGAAYGFSGYLISMHDSLGYLLCAATAPWALAWLDRFLDDGARRSLIVAAATWALCLFAGDAQGFATVGLGLGVLAWWRRRWLRAGWVAGVTALLGAPQWLPAALVGQDTARGALSRAEVALWSTHPLRLLELVAGPLYFAQPGTELGKALARDVLSSGLSTTWAATLVVAPVATVFALRALHHHRSERGARLLAGVTVVALWLALGKHLGASRVLVLLPFRYPEKWMPWVALGLALGAAHGVKLDARRWLQGLGVACGVAAALVAWRSPAVFGELAWLALLISAVMLVVAGVARLERPWGLAVLALLVVVPAARVLQVAEPSVLDVTRGFTPKVGTARAYRLMGKLDGAAGEPARLTTALVDVLDPVARGVELGNTYLPARTAWVDTLVESPQWLQLTRLGSVRYLSVSQPDLARVAQLPTVASADQWKVSLLEDEGALPRAYLAQAVCAEKPAVFMVAHPSFEPSRQVLLPCAPTARPPETHGVVDASADLLRFRTRADGPMVLVVTDAFARGWSYDLDGQPVVMERANLAFQAVRVPAGEHEVTRRYRTPGLGWAGLLFLLGVAAAARRATVAA